ncbi:NH(3)-dependent NAD(+) synthetase [Natrinema pellirubrum DSM 15624]|uniref:NH(3)-dependent NAD(+) synthetase n=1 Tax=Natrinema pellirubrum (strain DSM 15624 / CIP 106293 / JCM 10476 / NCIMB 786 / 157) TaxID=797303 RepID=L0JPJ8_NATP1|nr:NAD(+) synthase [Natrinema pellirubrum]AGB32537.1 NAD+ synthetase [Natrinema pellirubrum DSM 15624]ELY73675.1 NH(3)-dependent NAD(+) synthetase [Natrinema pellirubrum DSM 15624]
MTVSGFDSPIADLPRGSDGLATTDDALSRLRERLPTFLERVVADAGAEGVVVPLDGGVETALAATFAVDAVGQDHVTGLVMPAFLSHEAVSRNAEAVATSLGIDHSRLQLQPVLAAFQETIGGSSGPADDLVATTNALSRLRMTCAYYVANATDALVAGPINRTQYLLGSVAKHGETGADCLPFAGLYRAELEALARAVGIPEDLTVEAAGSPLHPGGSPATGLDADPETVDRILRRRIDEGVDAGTVADRTGVETETVERLAAWVERTRHKRRQPVRPSTGV